jgi:DNA repair protein RadC
MPIQSTSSHFSEIKVSYSPKIKASDRKFVSSSEDATTYFRSIWSEHMELREEFYILLLNRANKVLGWFQVSTGGMAGTVVDPKLVFSVALKCCAHAIILCHNHPSGNLKPSQADIQLTKKIKEGGKLLEIEVLDHIIITSEAHFSFTDDGII